MKASSYKGQTITIQDPDGWTDWNSATDIIVQELQAIGIHAVAYFPQDAARNVNLTDGTYDLALDNNAGPSSNPWSYFDRVFQLPILKKQTAQLNWERDDNPAAWALVQKLGTISADRRGGLAGHLLPARADRAADAAGDPAVVQRGVGAVQHDVLEGLPDVDQPERPVHPRHVGWLARQHDHRPRAGPPGAGPRRLISITN